MVALASPIVGRQPLVSQSLQFSRQTNPSQRALNLRLLKASHSPEVSRPFKKRGKKKNIKLSPSVISLSK
jgi:hypothetical protein